jgi:hypothetical protein
MVINYFAGEKYQWKVSGISLDFKSEWIYLFIVANFYPRKGVYEKYMRLRGRDCQG